MRDLRYGDKGDDVREVQQRCTSLGFYLKVDGGYGPKTESQIRIFQAAHNLPVTGVVNDTTRAILFGEKLPSPVSTIETKRQELRSLYQHPPVSNGVLSIPACVVAVLEAAINDLGKKETPDGSNAGPEIEHLVGKNNAYSKYYTMLTTAGMKKYKEKLPLSDSDYLPPPAWCGLAVMGWIRIGLGLPMWEIKFKSEVPGHPFKIWTGSVRDVELWAVTHDRWLSTRNYACPGVLFTMSRSRSSSDAPGSTNDGHIGMVVLDTGTHIHTIEGNTGNKVSTYLRSKNDVRGFIQWWD